MLFKLLEGKLLTTKTYFWSYWLKEYLCTSMLFGPKRHCFHTLEKVNVDTEIVENDQHD